MAFPHCTTKDAEINVSCRKKKKKLVLLYKRKNPHSIGWKLEKKKKNLFLSFVVFRRAWENFTSQASLCSLFGPSQILGIFKWRLPLQYRLCNIIHLIIFLKTKFRPNFRKTNFKIKNFFSQPNFWSRTPKKVYFTTN